MEFPIIILADTQNASLAPALVGAASALIVAVVAAGLGYWRYVHERAHGQETRLNALFGELANIYEHYSYAAYELPVVGSDAELPLRLRLSLYGDLRATQEISEYGFLSAGDIRLLLQLGLRIRNNDKLLEMLLEDVPAIKATDLSYAKQRMAFAIDTTRGLIDRLVAHRPRLRKILKTLEKDLPSIHNRPNHAMERTADRSASDF